jgi:hypothetical protein
VKASSSQTKFLCVVCFREFSHAHHGEAGVKRHILTKIHKDKLRWVFGPLFMELFASSAVEGSRHL